MLIILCLVYCIIETKMKSNQRKYVVYFWALGLSVLMAYRPTDTKDTLNYIRVFEEYALDRDFAFHLLYKYKGVEYGFLYLNVLFKTIFSDYRLWFFCVSFFNSCISVGCLHRMKNYILAEENPGQELYGMPLLGYMAYMGVMYSGIVLRGGISITLSLMAIDLYIRKKNMRALICATVAFSVQRMCIVLVAGLVANRIFKLKSVWQGMAIWMLQGFLLMINVGAYFIEAIARIVKSFFVKAGIGGFFGFLQDFDNSVGKIDWLIWLVIGICICLYKQNQFYRFFLHIVLLGGWVVVFLHGVRAISRMYDYYIMFCIPLLSSGYYQKGSIKLSAKKLLILITLMMLGSVTLKLAFF